MPMRVLCRECGYLLMEHETIPGDVDWYYNLYSKFEGRCPKCGHSLPDLPHFKQAVQIEVLDPYVKSFQHDYHLRRPR